MSVERSQPPVVRLAPPPCSAGASVVTIRVTDAAGSPVEGAHVRVTRVKDGKRLPDGQQMRKGDNEYVVLQDDALSWLDRGGEAIRVAGMSGARRASVVLTIGRDASGCRAMRLRGPAVLSVR